MESGLLLGQWCLPCLYTLGGWLLWYNIPAVLGGKETSRVQGLRRKIYFFLLSSVRGGWHVSCRYYWVQPLLYRLVGWKLVEFGDSPWLIHAYYIADNLVEGKRKRRSNLGSPSTSSSSTTPTRKGQESPRVPPVSLSGKRKLIASEDERSPAKRGRKSAVIKPGENLIFCS